LYLPSPPLPTASLFAVDLTGRWLHEETTLDGNTTQFFLIFQQTGSDLSGRIGNKNTHYTAKRTTDTAGDPPPRLPLPALHHAPYNGLAAPPMGWNSWNQFATKIDDHTVRAQADAMVSSGMRDAEYVYINIDDTWEGPRDAEGADFPT